MKLMHGKLSPFVRKVMIAAYEKGLADQIEIVSAAVGQGKVNYDLMALNPTGKIPTLISDDGDAIFDSLVICDYLDGLAALPRMVPRDAAERTQALRLNAVADGLLVAGVLGKIEQARPAEKQWPEFMDAQFAKVRKCIEAIDNSVAQQGDRIDIGTVAVVCALGWLDARAPEFGWRSEHPRLAEWYAAWSERDSARRTAPQSA